MTLIDEPIKPQPNQQKKFVCRILRNLGNFLGLVLGLWAFILNLSIIYSKWGPIAAIFSFVGFPFTVFIAPVIFIFTDGIWFPFILAYGSSTLIWIIKAAGWRYGGDDDEVL